MSELRIGIEIHQRLSTEKKLFCTCRNSVSTQSPCKTIRRRLKAVSSELGRIDPAAVFEAGKEKEFLYYSFEDCTCQVEEDEEPPHEINQEALDAAIEVALLLNAVVLDEVHVMRKTVVDGSSVSGFQRTALVAVNGFIETSKGRVGIPTICVEEESAGIVEKKEGEIVYRLDRQGIPLIEIATSPDLVDGVHAREVAEKIGLLLRSTGRVQRGIGTIRQDLNVSVSGGARVEIKGAQELNMIEKLVENEVLRQKNLLEIKRELSFKKVFGNVFSPIDFTNDFMETNCFLIRKAIDSGKRVLAIKLSGFKGFLAREIIPGHRFGSELSDYAKAFSGVLGIIHSDEDLRKYCFSEKEVKAIEERLGVGGEDAWVLCAEEKEKAEKALNAVFQRALAAFEGVPKETRRAEGERSFFMRPLPGSSRMYPETDVVPIRIDENRIKRIRKMLPPSFEERKKNYLKLGLSEVLAEKMVRSQEFDLFERIVCETNANPTTVAATLLETFVNLRRSGFAVDEIQENELKELFLLFKNGRIVSQAIPEALKALCLEKKPVLQVIEEKNLWKFDEKELIQIIKEFKEKGFLDKNRIFNEAMSKYRLRVEAKDFLELLGE